MTAMSTEVLIVGSGPVGATFARLVMERHPTASVTMIELGPTLTEPLGMNVANLPLDARTRAQALSCGPLRHRPMGDGAGLAGGNSARPGLYPVDTPGLPAAAMVSCVGGMGAHWSCATPRPRDSERIPFIADDRWQAALLVAEELLATSHDLFADSPGGRAIRSVLGSVPDRHVGVLPVAGRLGDDGEVRWSGTDTILEPALAADRFRLLDETICRALVVAGDRVTGAAVEHLPSGVQRRISASAVVVAADSLRTPQLLWASGIRPPALGRYLNEHTMISAAVELDTDVVPPLTDVERAHEFVSLSHVPFADGHHPFHGQVAQVGGGCDGGAGCAALTWFGRKTPTAADHVAFSDSSVDWCGMPAINVTYELTDAERDELAWGLRLVETASSSLGRYLPGGCARIQPAGSSLHYQGTVRMGEQDDGTSVCDSHSRVWRFANLFVGGNGVIPTVTACNPTLTSVALAARAIDAVLDVLD